MTPTHHRRRFPALLALLLALAPTAPAVFAADGARTVILVRHAERTSNNGDLPLSEAGIINPVDWWMLPGRLVVSGQGSSDPVADNRTPTGRARTGCCSPSDRRSGCTRWTSPTPTTTAGGSAPAPGTNCASTPASAGPLTWPSRASYGLTP